jgi:hypothetical protein
MLINQCKRIDELPLSLARRSGGSRQLQLSLENRERLGCERWIPELMELGHGHAPMCHGARPILLRDSTERLFGGFVSERMQQRDTTVESILNDWRTRDRERDSAEFLRWTVIVLLLRG